jgi:hypothetical protein
MKIRLAERKESKDLTIFLDAETIEDSALILRLAGSMSTPNCGWVNFSENTIGGWISVPLKSNITTSIESGKKS